MKKFDTRRAFTVALLPAACAAVLSGCASYESISRVFDRDATVAESPSAMFDRLDVNRDGFLSRGEVEPLGIHTSAGSVESATAAFHRLDSNGDGFLSRGEAQATMAAIPGGSFDGADSDRNGFLSLAEAMPHLRWLESRSAPGVVSFDAYDSNRDGFLSRGEADTLLRSAPIAGRGQTVVVAPMSFERLDTNRDGFLSRAEAAPIAGAVTFDRYDANRDGFLSRSETDPLMGSIGGTTGTYGGTVYGPRY
jgi:Ca2+-binding EF-hand superfamily protein